MVLASNKAELVWVLNYTRPFSIQNLHTNVWSWLSHPPMQECPYLKCCRNSCLHRKINGPAIPPYTLPHDLTIRASEFSTTPHYFVKAWQRCLPGNKKKINSFYKSMMTLWFSNEAIKMYQPRGKCLCGGPKISPIICCLHYNKWVTTEEVTSHEL